MYAALHNHTYYSLLDGVVSPEQLAQRAADLGIPALALTDHDALYGAIPFAQACEGVGITPLIGAELTVTPITSPDESFRTGNTPQSVCISKLAAVSAVQYSVQEVAILVITSTTRIRLLQRTEFTQTRVAPRLQLTVQVLTRLFNNAHVCT